jgi:hypothetical protein
MKKYSVELPNGDILYIQNNIKLVSAIRYTYYSTKNKYLVSSFYIEYDNVKKQSMEIASVGSNHNDAVKVLNECRDNILKALEKCTGSKTIKLNVITLKPNPKPALK